jgi:hypothetical protein
VASQKNWKDMRASQQKLVVSQDKLAAHQEELRGDKSVIPLAKGNWKKL